MRNSPAQSKFTIAGCLVAHVWALLESRLPSGAMQFTTVPDSIKQFVWVKLLASPDISVFLFAEKDDDQEG